MLSKQPKPSESEKLANTIRRHVITMVSKAKASHVGSCLSMADILAVLYNDILRINPETVDGDGRDRFILSKGHGCAALYATLAEKGFFALDSLSQYYQDGSNMFGHSTCCLPGVEVSTGSLGLGLSIACGMALAAKRDHKSYRVFALLSDGECDEGSTWEAALFAPQHKLDNLVTIIDYNKIQALGWTKEILDLEPFRDKWEAFGWSVKELDGHNHQELNGMLASVPFEYGKPSCLIAHTVKGKGVGFMENSVLWHYRAPDPAETKLALDELEQSL